MNTLQELRDLLKPESTATIEDWMKYATTYFKDLLEFMTSEAFTEKLEDNIRERLSCADLSYEELQDLIKVADDIIQKKKITTDNDNYPLMAWSGLVCLEIEKELQVRLNNFSNQTSYSDDYVALLSTMSLLQGVGDVGHEKQFIAAYKENVEKILPLIHTQIDQYVQSVHTSQDSELLDMLQKEQEFVQNPDMSAEKKFERYGKMDEELNCLSGLLINYKNYVEQTITDKSKPKKVALITKLNEIIQDSKLPLCVRMYQIKKLISQPENQATLMQDSWGAKLLAAVRDFFSFLFPREQTHSEFYKERLLALKQEAVKTQENTPLDAQTSQTTEQNKGSGMG